MLEIKNLKDIEARFRQFGYEGEDIFHTIVYIYTNILNMEISEKLAKITNQGKRVSEIVFSDKVLKEMIYYHSENDGHGNNLTTFYQYFLAKRFRDISGKFFTPHMIAKQMARMLPVKSNALIMDPTCGCGTFLKEVSLLWNNIPCHLIGNDIDEMLICLTELVLNLNANDSQNISLFTSNIYDPNQELKSLFGHIDYVIANPPFSLPINIFKSESQLFQSGYKNSDALLLDLSLELLKPDGRLVCLLPHSIIANKEYEKLRQIVEKNWVLVAIITLPEGIFKSTANTTTRADIIVLDKKGKNTQNRKTIFANVSSVGLPLKAKSKKLDHNDLESLLDNEEVTEILGI